MRATLAILLTIPLAAQTYIVDAGNGSGTNYTTLTAAAAAVPNGAVLLVRAGGYAGFAIAQKGLTVLADPGVSITGTIDVSNTNPSQSVTLYNLSWPASGAPCVRLTNCQGAVGLERLTTAAFPAGGSGTYWPLEATSCNRLTVRACSLWGIVSLQGCQAVFERCTLQGWSTNVFSATPTSSGLRTQTSSVQIVDSTLRGGDGFGSGPIASVAASPGLEVYNGSVRVLDSVLSGGFDGAGQRAALLGGNATARIDLLSWPQGGVTFAPTYLSMPYVTTTGAAPGGTLTATTATLAGDLVALIVGLPGAPTTLSGFQDAFWLDPGAHVFLAIGVQQTGTPITGSIPVPNVAGFRGLQFVWHAVCYGPVTGLQNSNPSVTLVH